MVSCVYCQGPVVDGTCEDCGRVQPQQGSLVSNTLGGVSAPSVEDLSPVTTKHTTSFTVQYPTRGTSKNQAGTKKTTRRRTDASTHTSTRRNALGGGLISLPELPTQDPLGLLMAVPEVPEHKRKCGSCDAKVSRVKGFCGACGAAYDFAAHLKAGDLIADKYEIKGPIAFGGLGWIYLGYDIVLDRYVILKGLLNTKDPAAAAAAVAERRYLAAVKHAKIVGIYDFIQHGKEGFIVMEYVGGTTLQSVRKTNGPLPPAEAIAYILGILPAFGYLHQQNMVYCDFKPDNIMLEAGDVKLIDLGAVRRINDPHGDIYATIGYAAPEADTDPQATSDLYTLGRGLAVLIMDFKFASDYVHSLPSPNDHAVLAQNESLYRFLLRATHVDPDERFQTAEDMSEQLFGILREMVSTTSVPQPIESKIFEGDRWLPHSTEEALLPPTFACVPNLKLDAKDRALSEVATALASALSPLSQFNALAVVQQKHGSKATEPSLQMARLLTTSSDLKPAKTKGKKPTFFEAKDFLDPVDEANPFEWRTWWLRGLAALKDNRGADARECFERVYFELPGELAPRLGMGLALELQKKYDMALSYYERVVRVDPRFVSAHFGAARCLIELERHEEAITALMGVPETHQARDLAILSVAMVISKFNAGAPRLAAAQAKDELIQKITAMPTTESHLVLGRLFSILTIDLEAPNLVNKMTSGTLKTPPFFKTVEVLREEASMHFRKAAAAQDDFSDRVALVDRANAIRTTSLT
jgi:serine/threonine-protein kinase PknG